MLWRRGEMQKTVKRLAVLLVIFIVACEIFIFAKLDREKLESISFNYEYPPSIHRQESTTIVSNAAKVQTAISHNSEVQHNFNSLRRLNLTNNVTSEPLKLILVSSNPRSGSSFLGDILTMDEVDRAGGSSKRGDAPFYFFEPLRWLVDDPPENRHSFRSKLGANKYKDQNDGSTKPEVSRLGNLSTDQKLTTADDFLNCRFGLPRYRALIVSNAARKFVFRKPQEALGSLFMRVPSQLTLDELTSRWEDRCAKSRLRLLKTIRMDAREAVELLNKDGKTRALILVRDPRAILASISRSPTPWEEEDVSAEVVCRRLLLGLAVAEEEGNSERRRMMLVRYEDMADATRRRSEAQRVAAFLGLRDADAADKILRRARMLSEPTMPEVSRSKRNSTVDFNNSAWYWTVHRGREFRYDSWVESVSKDILIDVGRSPACVEAIARLGYREIGRGDAQVASGRGGH